MKKQLPLPFDALANNCRPEDLPYPSTDDIPDLAGILGQKRALEAIRFGLTGRRPGYNLFALGTSGIGKHSIVMQLISQRAGQGQTPPDLCYVADFKDRTHPRLLALPAGRGNGFREDMQHLVEELGEAIPAALEGDEFKARLRQIEREFENQQAEAVQRLREKAEQQKVHLYEQPGEFTFAPLYNGELLDAEAFSRLPRETQAAIETKVSALQSELTDILEQRIPQLQKERRAAIRRLRHDVTRMVATNLLEALREKYRDLPAVITHLESVESEVVHNAQEFLRRESGTEHLMVDNADRFRRYLVNLLVDNSQTQGAPVVYEDNPTFNALIGRIEHIAQLGTLVTDFNLIQPGALHRANGGYLVLNAQKLLMQPFAWDALKRALQAHELRIESMGQAWNLISTVSLEPEALPLDVKVVLEGDRLLYYMLQAYDPEFSELFKVAADFEDNVPRAAENIQDYASLIATLVRKEKLRAFDRSGIAAIIDYSARLAADAKKLSTHMRDILDLMHESDHYADEGGHEKVLNVDVRKAIQARIERVDRARDILHEEIQRDILTIATDGRVIGQVNGLAVSDMGNFSFGSPVRITATTRLGEGEVVDIEREVDLGGSIHSKGVFILSSFLGARYATNFPLSLSASLAFEQTYSGIEGDSASLAELCALLSSLSKLPLHQSLAVTGSVDQQGGVQAVGGVNEKIEGFYEVCAARGLDGKQAVIIPQSNVQHLMLRDDVVDAASKGQFSIYAVNSVDQAMQLLTGRPAGRINAHGEFPPRTVNGLVQQRLADLARLRLAFSGGAHDGGGSGPADSA